MANPFMQYKQQSINTMSSGELIVKLFDEAHKHLMRASMLMQDNNLEAALISTDKAKRIFSHLISVLDFSVEISHTLYQFYSFFNQQIISAEVKRAPGPIDDILPLVAEFRATWAEAERLVHINR